MSVCDTLANNMLLIISFFLFLQVNAASSPAAAAATSGGGENKKQPGPSQLNNELEFPSCNGGDTRLVKGKSMPSLR